MTTDNEQPQLSRTDRKNLEAALVSFGIRGEQFLKMMRALDTAGLRGLDPVILQKSAPFDK